MCINNENKRKPMAHLILTLILSMSMSNFIYCFDFSIEKHNDIIKFKSEQINYSFELEIMEERSVVGALDYIKCFIYSYHLMKSYFPAFEIQHIYLNNKKIIVDDRSISGNEKGDLFRERFLNYSETKDYLKTDNAFISIIDDKLMFTLPYVHETVEAMLRINLKQLRHDTNLNTRWFYEGVAEFIQYKTYEVRGDTYFYETLENAKKILREHGKKITLGKWEFMHKDMFPKWMDLQEEIRSESFGEGTFIAVNLSNDKKHLRHEKNKIAGGIENVEDLGKNTIQKYYNVSFFIFYLLFNDNEDQLIQTIEELYKISEKNNRSPTNKEICKVINKITGKNISSWLKRADNIK